MSVVPSLFSGIVSNPHEASINTFTPSSGFGKPQFMSKNPTLYMAKECQIKRPKLLNAAIDYSSRRGVLNCRTDLTHKVLREAPVTQTMKPPTGMGRHQLKSVSQMDAPVFGRFMPFADSHNAGMNSKLGIPA